MNRSLKAKYRDIEMRVYRSIKEKVEKSKVQSEFVDSKALVVKGIPALDDMLEVVIVNDRIVMLDKNGYHQDFSSFNLEEWIDINELF